jgi:predicted porin
VNNNGGDSPVIGPFRVRRAEIGLQSRDYGSVLFGRGSAFSDGIAELDLSGTDIAIYAYAPDSWGGLQFADRTAPMRRAGDPIG